MISCNIDYLRFYFGPVLADHTAARAGADIRPVIRTDHDSDSDRVMDPDEERNFVDQGPPSD